MANLFSMKVVAKFNRKDIEKWITKTEKKALQKAGEMYRVYVMREMKQAPKGVASAPGDSFNAHPVGKKNIANTIQYGLELDSRTLVVGPAHAQDIFYKHEKGGRFNVKNSRRKKRKIGDVGLMRYGSGKVKNQNGKVRITNRKDSSQYFDVPATWGRIKTQKGLNLVNRLEEEVYGPFNYNAMYPRRPVLENALKNNRDKLNEVLAETYGDMRLSNPDDVWVG